MEDKTQAGTTQAEAKEKKPRKRRMKKRYKIPLVILCVLVGLLILAQVLAGPVGRAVAQQQVSKALGTPFRIESLKVNLFGGSARVRGVALSNPPAEPNAPADGPPLAGLTSLAIDVSLPALMGGRVVVKNIEVDGPTLLIERGPDGKTNLDRLAERIAANAPPAKPEEPPAAPGKPTPLTIERLRVTNGAISYIDRSQGDPPYEMRIEGLTVTADNLSTEEPAGEPSRPLEVKAALASGDQKGQLVVEALFAALKKPLNADFKVRVEQANLEQLPLVKGDAGSLRARSGLVVFTSTAKIRNDAIDADQTVSVRDLQFAHTARDLMGLRLLGVPVEVLNVFLKATEGLLYVEFPVGGTLDEPEVSLDKALQDTVAAGPGVMLNRVAALGTDFLKAGKDLKALAGKALDDAARTVLDPKSWRLTGTDTGGILRLPDVPKIDLPKLPNPFGGGEPRTDTPAERAAPTTQGRPRLRDLLGG